MYSMFVLPLLVCFTVGQNVQPPAGPPSFGGAPGSFVPPADYYYETFAPSAGPPGTYGPPGTRFEPAYPATDSFNFYPDVDNTAASIDPTAYSFTEQGDYEYTKPRNISSSSISPTGQPLDSISSPSPSEVPAATLDAALSPNHCRWDDEPFEPGARMDHGSFWFECQGGKFSARGCFSDLGQRLLFGQSYNVSNGYEMLCDRAENGTFRIRPMACLHAGKKYMPGETFQDSFYWYTCLLKDDSISKETSGCIDAQSNRVPTGGIFRQGSNLFQCNYDEKSNGVSLDPVACLHRGQRYEIGQHMIDGLFWYTCKKRGPSFLAPELTGCFYANRTMKVSDKYYRSGFVYQCQRKDDGSLGHVIVGCLETNPTTGDVTSEKHFGETWPIGNPPYMFMAYCDKSSRRPPSQRLVHCMYSTPGKNDTVIRPGCYKQVSPDLMVLCYDRGDGALGIDRAGPAELHKVISLGLVNCP